MRVLGTVLSGCLAASAVGMLALREPMPDSAEVVCVEYRQQEAVQSPVDPSPPSEALEEVPLVAEPPIEPVVPPLEVEERGDAMLFEIDALVGTPFDQAITMPFD